MSIWTYAINRLKVETNVFGAPPLFYEAHNLPNCPYCREPLRQLRRYLGTNEAGRDDYMKYLDGSPRVASAKDIAKSHSVVARISVIDHVVRVCPTCGWWIAFQETVQRHGASITVDAFGGVGGLVEFDVGREDVPLQELRRYLLANYDARFAVHPRVFEDAVASVFHDLGYRSRVTAYSGDDGIDVVLDGPNDTLTGVQVKRYKGVISVEQIRSLVGALVVNGYTTGMFVTTSRFTSGAQRTVDLAAAHGTRVELYDALRFFDALKITQRAVYESADDTDAPYNKPLQLLRSSVVEA